MIGLRRFHHPNYIENREVLSYFISSRLEWSNFNYMRPQTADRRSCPGTDSSSSVWKKAFSKQSLKNQFLDMTSADEPGLIQIQPKLGGG